MNFLRLTQTSMGTHSILSAIKEKAPKCRFYFAASSEMFALAKETPQNENTPFHPRSPYGISKVTGFYLTLNYRELMEFLLAVAYSLIMNHLVGVLNLSRGR